MGQIETNWYPVLAPAQADSALNIACDVAARISDIETLKRAARAAPEQSVVPAIVQWDPASTARGSAGVAILFGYLDVCFPNQGWDAAARQHLEFAAHAIESRSFHSPALFGGLSGTAFAAWCLSHNGSRYCGLSAALDAALFPAVAGLAEQVASATDGVANHNYDVISGLSGAGAYLLCRRELPVARNSLMGVLRSLIALSEDGADVPRWYTPASLMSDEKMALQNPGGVLNCGLSHGIPGPLALLALARMHDVDVEGLDLAIERLANWLAAHRTDDSWGVNWSSVVPLERTADGSLKPVADRRPTHAGWCYGSPGVARALWLAGKAIACQDYCDLALAAVTAAITKPVKARFLPSPTLCHGVAGLLQVTLRFAVDTGLPVFQQAASELTAELLGAYEPESILGYRSVEAGGCRVDNPGLLDGAPGVSLALLAASCPAEPIWDRLFLLS